MDILMYNGKYVFHQLNRMKLGHQDDIDQVLLDKTNGTARIVNLRPGFSVYTPAIRKDPINYQKYGFFLALNNKPYIEDEWINKASVSMESLISGDFGEKMVNEYEVMTILYIILKYTTTSPMKMLYLPETTFTFDDLYWIRRQTKKLHGIIYNIDGITYVDIYDKELLDVTPLDHLTKDEYQKLYETPGNEEQIINDYNILDQ